MPKCLIPIPFPRRLCILIKTSRPFSRLAGERLIAWSPKVSSPHLFALAGVAAARACLIHDFLTQAQVVVQHHKMATPESSFPVSQELAVRSSLDHSA